MRPIIKTSTNFQHSFSPTKTRDIPSVIPAEASSHATGQSEIRYPIVRSTTTLDPYLHSDDKLGVFRVQYAESNTSVQSSAYATLLSGAMLFGQTSTDKFWDLMEDPGFWVYCGVGIIIELAVAGYIIAKRRTKKAEAAKPLEEGPEPQTLEDINSDGPHIPVVVLPKNVLDEASTGLHRETGLAIQGIAPEDYPEEQTFQTYSLSAAMGQPSSIPPSEYVVEEHTLEGVALADVAAPVMDDGLTVQGVVSPFAEGNIECPSCQTANTPDNKFCSKCEFPLRLLDGKYRLVEKIGEGGMSEIYRAEHTEFKRNLAQAANGGARSVLGEGAYTRVIKVMKLDSMDTSAAKMSRAKIVEDSFRSEVATLSALSSKSPHIVQIHDVGSSWIGLYYVMEYLQGETLFNFVDAQGNVVSLLREGRFQEVLERVDLIAHILEQICDALAVCHKFNVAHRDLKLENIMLLKNERDDHFVKVIDFGIAAILSQKDGNKQSPIASGTPEYMPMEQLGGEPVVQSDIYALGVIVYHLLTGGYPIPNASELVKNQQILSLLTDLAKEHQKPVTEYDVRFEPFMELLKTAFKTNYTDRHRNVAEFMYALKSAVERFKESLKK
ncbi:MAG: serine/threonine-protein kinase [Pseudomonadota bacterium]